MRGSQLLAGSDTTRRSGLPVSEVLAPLPLAAIALLVINDRLLKGSGLPELVTGKLSDITGVFVFPLVAICVVDLVGYALRLGDYTLRRWKLVVAIAFTAIVFGSIKLSPLLGHWAERAWSAVVPGSTIYPDPTDVVALLALAGTWWQGRAAIARGAYGRLRLAQARKLDNAFADAAACGADPAIVAELDAAVTAWVAGGPAEPVDAGLSKLRSARARPSPSPL